MLSKTFLFFFFLRHSNDCERREAVKWQNPQNNIVIYFVLYLHDEFLFYT